ncbi:MAG: hypothetical protein EKK42_31240 [Pseudonocardiaceae bacterium]|nr:MAG: hypothetical protein EKK42_31240 [Pseudonocardiaceae bacterium]
MAGANRSALTRHALVTALVASLLAGLVMAGSWWYARDAARVQAERVARHVGAAVLVPLGQRDYAAGALDRDVLLTDVAPFLRSGIVDRVKVWTVTAGTARVAFSDEARIEGVTATYDAAWQRRFTDGDLRAMTVPRDAEHRFENGLDGMRMEVFLPFRDAGGQAASLEVYVPVDVGRTTRDAAAMLLAVVLAGVAVLAVATLPLTLALARRNERRRREQRAVRTRGLAAAELARRELAQRLHDDVIPDLAGIGLLLQAVRARGRATDDVPWELLDQANGRLSGDVARLRGLLDELVPPTGDLAAALRDTVDRLPADAPTVRLRVDLPPGAVTEESERLLGRVAGELLRNAVTHAAATTVDVTVAAQAGTVVLTVADDGTGFGAGRGRRTGHIGLQLVHRVVEDGGGHVDIVSAPDAGTTVTVTAPAAPPPADAGPVAPVTRPRSGRRVVRR